MKAKCFYSNGYFNARESKHDTLTVSLLQSIIPAKEWNSLRDNICNYLKIKDDVSVYFDYLMINGEIDRFCTVTVGDWRRLGFSGNNIKNCNPDEGIISEANRFFHDNPHILPASLHTDKAKGRIKDMLEKSYWTDEFKMSARRIHAGMRDAGMTDEEIEKWFEKKLRELQPTVKMRSNIPESEILRQDAKQAIHDRIVTPSARRFTPEQVEVLNRYHQVAVPDKPAGEVFKDLLYDVTQEPDVARKPEKWINDTAKELDDLAEGITREQQRGLHI